jgi:hypothetical protein
LAVGQAVHPLKTVKAREAFVDAVDLLSGEKVASTLIIRLLMSAYSS